MQIRKYPFVLAIAVFSLAVSAGCQKPAVEAARQTDLTPKKILSIDDEKFLHAAEKAELRQNSFAQLAEERSKNAKIQAFATKVTGDMSVALTELKDLMKAKHMTLPAEFAAEVHSDAAERLRNVSDGAFDHEFVSLMSVEGQETVRIFDSAAQTAADPDLRNYALRQLPALRANYDKASDLEKTLTEKPLD
jgi:putative membrane protein